MNYFIKELKRIKNDNKLNDGANTSLYAYVATNYNKMSKEELKELVLNLDYIMYSELYVKEYLRLENKAIEETIDRLGEN